MQMKQIHYALKSMVVAAFAAASTSAVAQPGPSNLLDATAIGVGDGARQSSTQIDAVVNNPAGTGFMTDGFHLSLSGLGSWQRIDCALANENNRVHVNHHKTSRITPSLQAAWKHGSWTLSGSWACEGGYGRYNNDNVPHVNGLSIPTQVAFFEFNQYTTVTNFLASVMIPGINVNAEDMFAGLTTSQHASLYKWVGRLGAAYRINDHLSVYVGAKLSYLRGRTNSDVGILMLRPSTGQTWSLADYWNAAADHMLNSDLTNREDMAASLRELAHIDVPSLHYTLKQNQIRVAPVIGLHYRAGAVNIGARYEFKSHFGEAYGTSDVTEAAVTKVGGYDLPDLLTVGADWQVAPRWNVAVGASMSFTSSHPYGRYTWLVGSSDFGWPKDKIDCTAAASVTFDASSKWRLTVGGAFVQQKGYFNASDSDIALPGIRYLRPSLGCSYKINDKCQLMAGVNEAFALSNGFMLNNNLNVIGETESGDSYTQTLSTREYGSLKHAVTYAIGINYSF